LAAAGSLRIKRKKYAKGEEETQQDSEGSSKTAGRFKAACRENRAGTAERPGIQVLCRYTKNKHYSYQAAAPQEARIAMTKAELRKTFLDRRGSLSVAERVARSRLIADRFFEKFDLSSVKNFHCFISIEKFNEVDTSPILQKIWDEYPAIRTFAPRLERDAGELRSHVYRPETKLVENVWGIREPASEESVDSSEIDLVIVPLLCFDERGYRVGYGKGFYDKFLAKCRPDCLKVGLSFFPPVGRIGDIDEYDIPLDQCVTPETVYDFG